MKSLIPTVGLLFLLGCNGGPGAMGGGGDGEPRVNHPPLRILLKKFDGTNCTSRTQPPSDILVITDTDEIVWDIKIKDGCLPDGTDLVIKWVDESKALITDANKTPTLDDCLEIRTDKHGNKSKISCKLRAGVTLNQKFRYELYLRTGGSDKRIEDPDVEIIMF